MSHFFKSFVQSYVYLLCLDPVRNEGMGTDQLCRIVVCISSQIGRDGHRDIGDVSTYQQLTVSPIIIGVAK